jgi:nitroreductase
MDLLKGLKSRRSVRQFTDRPVSDRDLKEILSAGMWAPSGLNNQPWRFVIVRDREVMDGLAGLTKYNRIIDSAQACIAVFIDKTAMYSEVKDYQAMGACIQNMLLAAHALSLGAVWLGEILKNSDVVRTLLGLPERLELMAVVALGHPAARNQTSKRKYLSEILIKEL